jgi:hypothetical protein
MARFTHPAIFDGGMSGLVVPHGSFYSVVDQTLAENTAGAMRYEITELSQGVTIENNLAGHPTRITTNTLGVFNIQFSAQFHYNGGGGSGQTVNIWLSHNGTAVPDTTTKIIVSSNNHYNVAAWNFFVNANTVPQYFELMWQTDNANIGIDMVPAAGSVPRVPSIILTVNQVA